MPHSHQCHCNLLLQPSISYAASGVSLQRWLLVPSSGSCPVPAHDSNHHLLQEEQEPKKSCCRTDLYLLENVDLQEQQLNFILVDGHCQCSAVIKVVRHCCLGEWSTGCWSGSPQISRKATTKSPCLNPITQPLYQPCAGMLEK